MRWALLLSAMAGGAAAVALAAGQPAVEPAARAPGGPAEGARAQAETGAADIPLAGADAGAVRVPSVPEAWGGERPDGAAALSDRVVRYQIRARLDPRKHTVEGEERLTWRNRSARPVRSVFLHLYLNAFESEGSTFMRELGRDAFRSFRADRLRRGHYGFIELKKVRQGGREVPWRFVHPDGGPDSDHTVARLDLPEPVAPGGSTELQIDFHDQLPRVLARTGHQGSYHFVAQWFPKIGVLELAGERGATGPRWNCHEFHLHSEFYADFGSYDVSLAVPRGFTVGATGALAEPPRETAEGVVHHYLQDDVHDFAWTAWDGFAPPLAAEWSHPGSPRVAVKVLHPPEYELAGQRTLKSTLEALTYFSDTLGPYPYATITAVVPPWGAEESGGMEYPTFFTTGGARRLNPEMPWVDYLAIHEFGHGYFYGILASNEFEEPFLDEGLNSFWDARMFAAAGRTMRWAPRDLRRLGIPLTPPMAPRDFERERGSVRLQPDALADNSWHRIGNYGFVYSGTSVWFHDLEERIGKEALERAFQAYYRRWKFRHPGTADLEQSLIESTGKPELIREFFQTAVYSSEALDDRIVELESDEQLPPLGWTGLEPSRREIDREERAKLVREARKSWRKQHGKEPPTDGPGPFPFRTTVVARRFGALVPQEILVKFADGSEKRLAWPERERWRKWQLESPSRARSAQLDPQRKLDADWNKLDDGRTIEPSRWASRRWTLEAGAWLHLLLAMLGAQ